MSGEHHVSTERISHTPAPWACFYKHKYNEWHVGVPLSRGSMKLALFPDGCPTDNPAADCLLIAAAPDLLAALKRLLAAQYPGTENRHETGCRCFIHEAQVAIAKAEGRS